MFVIQFPNGLYYLPGCGDGVELRKAAIFTDWNSAKFQQIYSGGKILKVSVQEVAE